MNEPIIIYPYRNGKNDWVYWDKNSSFPELKQDNQVFNKKKGIVRAFGYQNPPKAQSKLIVCLTGSIEDYIIDIRKYSPNYLKVYKYILSEKDRKMLYIPKGFAHGYAVLENNTLIEYKVDEDYSSEYEENFCFNDPLFDIKWPFDNILLSEKDREAKCFMDCKNYNVFEEGN